MIRIYADENHCDEQGKFLLDIPGSLEDIKKHQEVVAEGMVVLLNVQNAFEVQATLVFDKVWRAIPDFSTIHYLDEEG
jgi:hypothetical protein